MKDDLEQLLHNWPIAHMLRLPPDSTVVIAGVYQGKLAELLYELYRPARLVGYDPAKWAIDNAADRLSQVHFRLGCLWELHSYAIGIEFNAQKPMGEWGTDGCSFVNVGSREQGVGEMREISQEFRRAELDTIDLFVMNMEGYEFDLLPHMAAKHMFASIDLLAVQFHLSLGNDNDPAKWLGQLEQTHRRFIDHYPQWIVWKKYHPLDKVLE